MPQLLGSDENDQDRIFWFATFIANMERLRDYVSRHYQSGSHGPVAIQDWIGQGSGGSLQVPASLAEITASISDCLRAFHDQDKDAFVKAMADVLIDVLAISQALRINLGDAVLRTVVGPEGLTPWEAQLQ